MSYKEYIQWTFAKLMSKHKNWIQDQITVSYSLTRGSNFYHIIILSYQY